MADSIQHCFQCIETSHYEDQASFPGQYLLSFRLVTRKSGMFLSRWVWDICTDNVLDLSSARLQSDCLSLRMKSERGSYKFTVLQRKYIKNYYSYHSAQNYQMLFMEILENTTISVHKAISVKLTQ